MFEPMYDSYQACIALAGARADPGPAAAGRRRPLPLRPRRAARRDHAADAADPAEHAAQPDGQGVRRSPSWPRSPRWPSSTTCSSSPTRSTSTSCSRAPRHVPIATLPGMAERTLTISSGGKTFNTTGWKIGWMCGPAAMVHGGQDGQAVPHLRQRGAVPAGDRRRPRPRPTSTSPASPSTSPPSATGSSAGCAPPGSTTFVPEATYFTTVDIRPIQPDGDGMAFCRSLPDALRRRRHPEPGVLRPHRARPAHGALRLLQAHRGARRGGHAAGVAVVSTAVAAHRRDPARHHVDRPRRQLRAPRPAWCAPPPAPVPGSCC